MFDMVEKVVSLINKRNEVTNTVSIVQARLNEYAYLNNDIIYLLH